MKRLLALAIAMTTAGVSTPVLAQGTYRSTPIGGRTTLMGGAGIADGRDGAAAFLNPATIVRVNEGRLTFSVNFYSLAVHSAPSWFRPGRVDTARFGDVEEGSTSMTDVAFDALPSSLCLFFKTGDDTKLVVEKDALGRKPRLGICFATTQGEELVVSDQAHEQRTGAGVTRQAQTLSQRYTRFAIGPTYALHLTEGLAFGASLHASLVSHRSLVSASATTTGIGAPIRSFFFSSSRGTSFQLNAIAGATYRFGKQTVGLAVETPSFRIAGYGGANRDVHFDDGATRFRSTSAGEGSFASRTPMRVGIGTAFVDSWGAAEIDFSYFAPLGQAYRANLQGRTTEDSGNGIVDREVTFDDSGRARGVVDASAGVEIFVTPSLSILGGLSTDLSAAPDGQLQRGLYRYFDGRAHRVAGSFGVGSHGPEGDLLFGTELSFARGDRLTIDPYTLPPELAPTSLTTFRMLLVVAGSTSFRAIRRAVEDVTNVLGPKKPPVK